MLKDAEWNKYRAQFLKIKEKIKKSKSNPETKTTMRFMELMNEEAVSRVQFANLELINKSTSIYACLPDDIRDHQKQKENSMEFTLNKLKEE